MASSVTDELIVVHGGGSFGHPGAEKFGLNSEDPKSICEATSRVQNDMRVLNNRIIEMMIKKELWPISIPGGVVTRYDDGDLLDIDNDVFNRYLDLGNVPVTFGDVALDDERGVTICSGDDLMLALGERADRAIFVTNVDGIYKDKELVKTFTEKMYPLTEKDIPGVDGSIDVTGGMNGKVEKMLELSEHCPTFVINGTEEGRLKRLILKKETIYTEVKR